MQNAVFHLTYASSITLWGAMNPFMFKRVEKVSKTNNAEHNIKGFLLFKDGRFFHYLEGSAHNVEHLYNTLLHDHRHKNLKRLTEGYRSHYLFDKWDMYCYDIAQNPSETPISQLFDGFDSYRWATKEVDNLLVDMGKHYENHCTKK